MPIDRDSRTVSEVGPAEVVLRDVAAADLPILFEQQRDPVSVRMAAFPSRDREAFDAHWVKIQADSSVITKSIVAGGRVVGHILSFDRGGVREVGYWIGQESWGRGFASRALAAFLPIDGTRPLYARVAEHNAASLRVAIRCGFVEIAREEGDPSPDGEPIIDVLLRLE